MIMRLSDRLFLWGIGALVVLSAFSFIAYGNVHFEEGESHDEASSYGNAPVMIKEYIQDSCHAAHCSEMKQCSEKVTILQWEIEQLRRLEMFSSPQPTCNPVFKRFLAKLLREFEKLGLPTAETAEKHYDAEVKLSKQMMSEIQKFVNDEGSWTPGALDDALSQILINFKLHDYEAWKGRVEDTFNVELGTVIKMEEPTCTPVFKSILAKLLSKIEKLGLPTAERHYYAEVKLSKQMVSEIQTLVNDESSWMTGSLEDALNQILDNIKLHDNEARTWCFEDPFSVNLDTVIKVLVIVLIIVAISCIVRWSGVSWFVLFLRIFAVCLLISLVWNWLYLYKMACAEYQAKMVKWEEMMDKCTGGKKNNLLDNFKDWYRTTWTLQDDPCKEYFELLFVHPILRVPPTKVITMTLTTLITDPLTHLGQGINGFLRALLKDLSIALQIIVLIIVPVLSKMVFCTTYSVGQAVVHAVLWCLRGQHQDPPPGIADQPDAPPNRLSGEKERLSVKTLQNAERLRSGGETVTQKEPVAEDLDQHTIEEVQPTTSKEPSGTKDNKVSGNTERN